MDKKENDFFKIISVSPNLIQIEITDIDEFRNELEDQLRVGSYLQISDNESHSIIAIIKGYKIQNKENEINKDNGSENRTFVIDTQPIGFLGQDNKFSRGGQQIAIPPTNVVLADKTILENIYKEELVEKSFKFSTLSQNNDVNVTVDGDKFFSKHIAVVGSTGSGKSCTVAKILQEAMSNKDDKEAVLNNSHIVLFDLHSEYYSAFPDANYLNEDKIMIPYWLLNAEELEELFIESNEQNSYNQVSQFKYAVIENKKRHNPDIADKLTYDTPVYFSIQEVLNYISNVNEETIDGYGLPKLQNAQLLKDWDDKEIQINNIDWNDKQKLDLYFKNKLKFEFPNSKRGQDEIVSKGNWRGDFNRFVSRLEVNLSDDRLNFLLKPLKDKNDLNSIPKSEDFGAILRQFIGYIDENESNVTIIDLSGIPFEVLNIIVSLISRIIFQFCFSYKKSRPQEKEVPFLLVYEEAHNYLPKSDAKRYKAVKQSIERIAKEGRKYGISTMIVSQRPSEISETIFSQCNNFVAMRLTNATDQQYVAKLLPDSISAIIDNLPTLEQREALIIGDSIKIPSIVKIDNLERTPDSKDVLFNQEWRKIWYDIPFEPILNHLTKASKKESEVLEKV